MTWTRWLPARIDAVVLTSGSVARRFAAQCPTRSARR